MKLTDADIGALERALERAQDGIIYGSRVALAQRAYLAGKRSGREDMRERAAKVCVDWSERVLSKQDGSIEQVDIQLRMIALGPADCAAAIRALGVDDD